jgi:ubiquinone/menaquinone biosynthesis C-methylase UbiE
MDDSIRANRAYWNSISDEYQAIHDPQIGRAPKLWGAWSVPELEVNALGPVAGLKVLELGCGAARWAMALDAEGATVVGLDLSDRQLRAARSHSGRLRLVQAAGETLPFGRDAFDLVFCDHGALSWANPHLAVPEVARVLVPGGRLVFNASSPWLRACYDERADRTTTTLHCSYFDVGPLAEGDGAHSYPLGYGQWIRLFRASGLSIEDLIELRPPPNARSTYFASAPPDWHHHWPAEMLWVTTKPTAG